MARTTAKTTAGARKGKRRTTLIWIAAAAAIIVGLIWTEQVALLYVLATLSVTGLLVIVAMADLGGAQRPLTQPAPGDDSAAAGDGSSDAARSAKRR
ncbi:MAG: hypothetical protein QOD32_1347 [Pyrinomonadaceae bacterium]|jgi:hypothetical protein|nr:hypothetical protein [Pyrinomonadaceae bacterium]